MWCRLFVAVLALPAVYSTVFFRDTFDDDSWQTRWTLGRTKGEQSGEFERGHGQWYGDEQLDMGLRTTTDFRYYHASAPLDVPFVRGNDLIVQYTVKHEQRIECGGGYVKLYGAEVDPTRLNGDTPFILSFGPDICGTQTRHIVFTLVANQRKFMWKNPERCEQDHVTHLYTLILHPDDTFDIETDGYLRARGTLHEDLLPADGGAPLAADRPAPFDVITRVGFDLWQVRHGTVLDNLIITDDERDARGLAVERFSVGSLRAAEAEGYERADAEEQRKQAEIRRQVEEERKRQDAEMELQRLQQESDAGYQSARGAYQQHHAHTEL